MFTNVWRFSFEADSPITNALFLKRIDQFYRYGDLATLRIMCISFTLNIWFDSIVSTKDQLKW